MTWLKCADSSCNFKTQYINELMGAELLVDMRRRDQGFTLDYRHSDTVKNIKFELGGYGMYALNQPRHTFELGTSKLTLDDAQADEWASLLGSYDYREFSDGSKYKKFYSRYCCLILLQEEHENLFFQLKGKLDEMRANDDAFSIESEKNWAKMKQKYKAENGRDLPVVRAKDLIPDKPKN